MIVHDPVHAAAGALRTGMTYRSFRSVTNPWPGGSSSREDLLKPAARLVAHLHRGAPDLGAASGSRRRAALRGRRRCDRTRAADARAGGAPIATRRTAAASSRPVVPSSTWPSAGALARCRGRRPGSRMTFSTAASRRTGRISGSTAREWNGPRRGCGAAPRSASWMRAIAPGSSSGATPRTRARAGVRRRARREETRRMRPKLQDVQGVRTKDVGVTPLPRSGGSKHRRLPREEGVGGIPLMERGGFASPAALHLALRRVHLCACGARWASRNADACGGPDRIRLLALLLEAPERTLERLPFADTNARHNRFHTPSPSGIRAIYRPMGHYLTKDASPPTL